MAGRGRRRFQTHHGHGEIQTSRYLVLYVAQVAWFTLGIYLYSGAYWPSSCQPQNLLEIYGCSTRLPMDGGGWREAGLLTWLWATPLLVALEISRRFSKEES